MACYHPLKGWRAPDGTLRAARGPLLGREPMTVACGQCIGCRLEHSRQWAIRCVHEAQLHSHNNFLTLTYDNEHLPSDYSLKKEHLQKFLKRYRHHCGKIRYMACGEYGPETQRPHYHLIIFGHDWQDKELLKINANGDKIYTSKKLAAIWPYGNHAIGDVTFESAAYVARYVLGKMKGKGAKREMYSRFNGETGEVWEVAKEFSTMSRRPGIGKGWFEKFKTDVYPSDNLHLRGIAMRPPRYYDRAMELEDPELMAALKEERRVNLEKHSADSTRERLLVREQVVLQKTQQLKRPDQ